MIIVEDLLEDVCACGKEATHQCLHKLYWCPTCAHRGQFLDWGENHGYPALNCESYAVLEGEEYWMVLAAVGRDEVVWTFLAYIEWLEDEWTKEKVA